MMTAFPRVLFAGRRFAGALCFCFLLTSLLAACSEDEKTETEQSNLDSNNTSAENNSADNPNNSAAEANNNPNNDEPDAEGPLSWSVLEEGPYNVGYRTTQVIYTPKGSTEARRLRLAFWYPSEETKDRGASYIGATRPNVFEGVAPAIDGKAPLLVFSHGSNGFAEQSFSMTEFFASHGWVVVSPDHTGNTLLETSIPPETLEYRPQDISAVIDMALDLPEENPLRGKISEEEIILSGHSFGGYTTLAVSGSGFDVEYFLAACEDGVRGLEEFCAYFSQEDVEARFREGFHDPRVKAAIPMAPFGGIVFQENLSEIDIPVLLLTALKDRTLPPAQDGDPIWNALDGEHDIRIDFTTGGHFSFSNACEVAENLNYSIGVNDGCSPAFLDPAEVWRVANAYSLAFARFHLWGDESNMDLLNGTEVLNRDTVYYDKK